MKILEKYSELAKNNSEITITKLERLELNKELCKELESLKFVAVNGKIEADHKCTEQDLNQTDTTTLFLPFGKTLILKTMEETLSETKIDMWNKVETQLTNWPDTKDIDFEFKYFGDKQIRGVTGDCSCTDVTHKDGIVTGKIKHKLVKDMIPDIMKKREYNRTHNINVWFSDNSSQVLKIKAQIVEHENAIG